MERFVCAFQQSLSAAQANTSSMEGRLKSYFSFGSLISLEDPEIRKKCADDLLDQDLTRKQLKFH